MANSQKNIRLHPEPTPQQDIGAINIIFLRNKCGPTICAQDGGTDGSIGARR